RHRSPVGGGSVGHLVPVAERGALDPRLERLLVPPTGDHQPGRALVGRAEQLEALEAVLVVHGAGPCGEAPAQLVAGALGHGDGVDLDDGHPDIMPGSAAVAKSSWSRWSLAAPWRM